MKKNMLIIVLIISVFVIGCTPPNSCIAEGTQIATPTGDKLIENLQVGDFVYSYDLITQKLEPTKIIFIKKSTQQCYQFTASDNFSLTATLTHPIYSPQTGKYEFAERWFKNELTDFAVMQQKQTYISLSINLVTPVGEKVVYDITVDSKHANFIANGFLVHNKTPPFEGVSSINDLEVIDRTDSSLTLHWTVPGDSNLFPVQYDMRISDSLITRLITWKDQDTIPDMPTPRSAGARDTIVVIGLQALSRYWLTLQTITNQNYKSGFGNIVADSTL